MYVISGNLMDLDDCAVTGFNLDEKSMSSWFKEDDQILIFLPISDNLNAKKFVQSEIVENLTFVCKESPKLGNCQEFAKIPAI